MTMIVIFFSLLLHNTILFYPLFHPEIVFAQDGSPQTAPQVEISRNDYIQKLNDYRIKESQFFVATEQYKQIQTLAALEDAVKASKDVQLARIDTLTAYFQALRDTMVALKGAEVTKKSIQVHALQTTIIELEAVRAQIIKAQDRIALDNTSTQYQSRNVAYIATAYSALSLIKVSNIQSATDQLGFITGQVFDQLQASSPSATVLSEKQRSYDELSRTIADIKTVLVAVMKRVENIDQQNSFNSSSYSQIVDTLGQGFSKLQLAQSFLKEFAK